MAHLYNFFQALLSVAAAAAAHYRAVKDTSDS